MQNCSEWVDENLSGICLGLIAIPAVYIFMTSWIKFDIETALLATPTLLFLSAVPLFGYIFIAVIIIKIIAKLADLSHKAV